MGEKWGEEIEGEGRGMRGDLEGGGQRGEEVVQEIHLTTSDLQMHTCMSLLTTVTDDGTVCPVAMATGTKSY